MTTPRMEHFGIQTMYVMDSTRNERMGELNEVSLEIALEEKEWAGSNVFTSARAITGGKVTGKYKLGIFQPDILDCLTGGVKTAGATILVDKESGTFVAETPSVTVAHAADFSAAVRVESAAGVEYVKVAGPTVTTGQYAVTAGVYTFAAADAGTVKISYTYHTTATGSNIVLSNSAIAEAHTFQLIGQGTWKSRAVTLILPAVSFTKLAATLNMKDFSSVDGDFSAMATEAGTVLTWSFSAYPA